MKSAVRFLVVFRFHISMFEMRDGEYFGPRLVAGIGLDFVFGIGED